MDLFTVVEILKDGTVRLCGIFSRPSLAVDRIEELLCENPDNDATDYHLGNARVDDNLEYSVMFKGEI